MICVAGILGGCDGPTAIHRWAKNRKDWLKRLVTLPNGIPSRDCIRRVLIALKPEAFQKCFQAWIAGAVVQDSSGGKRLVAIDGKNWGIESMHWVLDVIFVRMIAAPANAPWRIISRGYGALPSAFSSAIQRRTASEARRSSAPTTQTS